ncbi:MAG: ATP-binding protein [Armatimonadota bacterium]
MSLLPTQPTPPKRELADLTILEYGFPKAGKTTWASHFPNSIFLATEAGQNAIECFQVPIDSWATFLAACNELAQGNHGFRTIVIDTVDNLWLLCQQHVCGKHKVEHESDLPYGKGYGLILTEFQRVLTKLSYLPYGLVMISHAELEEVKTRTGSYHRTVPALRERPRKIILGMADMILYCDLETVPGADGQPTLRRVMRTKPSPYWEAGDRTGRLPETIDLDFRAFLAAFEAAQQCPAMSGPANPAPTQGEDHE